MVELIEYANGILTILFVILSIIIGIAIINKYREKRQKEYLYFGLFWAGMTTPWWPQVVIFINFLITGTIIEMDFWVILGVAFLPFTVIIGIMAYLIVLPVKPERKNLIRVVTYTPNVIYEVFLIAAVILGNIEIWIADHDPTVLGEEFVIDWSLYSVPYFILSLIVFLIFGLWFSRLSMKSESKEVRVKGKFLFTAFISFALGTMVDFILPYPIVYFIARFILLSSTIEFYIGLLMPQSLKRVLVKS
ncbi:MAG: hypothetical protein GF317_18205 [Candidatus Lokiarchaeota archaeon]|nr:hypothetical protein [Candidatus Lokiarchaeota archaeon]MBD3201447.1 hypothetical protein [Candidatus Lokiarchaeota archaeon]